MSEINPGPARRHAPQDRRHRRRRHGDASPGIADDLGAVIDLGIILARRRVGIVVVGLLQSRRNREIGGTEQCARQRSGRGVIGRVGAGRRRRDRIQIGQQVQMMQRDRRTGRHFGLQDRTEVEAGEAEITPGRRIEIGGVGRCRSHIAADLECDLLQRQRATTADAERLMVPSKMSLPRVGCPPPDRMAFPSRHRSRASGCRRNLPARRC